MYLKLLDEYEKFLTAEGGSISARRHDARFEFALWLEKNAAQQSVQRTICLHTYRTTVGQWEICNACSERVEHI